jgi:hypothetical protein
MTVETATRLPDEPSTPKPPSEPPQTSRAPVSPKAPLRVTFLRHALLTVFPCRRALGYGVTPRDDLSTSDTSHETEEAALKYLEALPDEKIREGLAKYQDLHREEEARKNSAETRLTTVLGMSSIVSAITFGFVSVAFEQGTAARLGWIGVVATIVFLFAVFQLVISVWHAVRGLQVRLFDEMSGCDVLRRPNEEERKYLLRTIRDYSDIVRSHDAITGDKTEHLELAHRAILNFLGAVLLLVCMLATAGWSPRLGKPEPTLAEQLRADPNLVNALRGPKGDRGDIGPAGPPGPTGAQGERGPRGGSPAPHTR